MITVHVRLFASLRHHRPGLAIGETFSVELPDGATIGTLIGHLALPEDQVKIVFVNFVVRNLDHVLADGDEVGIFPPVGGG
jgi:molybdopterin converting factor small subunit